jgi:hypothetical protein
VARTLPHSTARRVALSIPTGVGLAQHSTVMIWCRRFTYAFGLVDLLITGACAQCDAWEHLL